jgi:tetratricopeptide (TPR) repeat protein
MRWIVFVVFTLLSSLVFSQETVLNEANMALQNKDFKKALDLYMSIENGHNGGCGMFKNMAIAAVGSGQEEKAILYYEKALKYAPNSKSIQKDINILRKRNPLLDEPVPVLLPVKFFNQITGIFSSEIWTVVSLIFLITGCSVIIFGYPFRSFTRRYWIILMASCVLFLLTFLFAWYRNHQIYHNKGMIVVSSDIVMKKSPDTSSPDVAGLPPGSKVYKRDQIADWYMVTAENGDTGWIPVSAAKKI